MAMSVFSPFSQKAVDTYRKKPEIWLVALLTCATILAYGNSLFNSFVWDDHDIIINNAENRDLSNFSTLFLSPDSTVSGNQKSYYRPLNRLTYMLDYQVFGLHPAGYHLENIIIHLMTVILLFFVAYRLFAGYVPAFIAALIFAVHPVNAEAVNFISARNNLLAAFFVLLTALVYLHAETTNRKTYYYLSGLFFFMGLLCKEPAIMLPVVLLAFGMTENRLFKAGIKKKMFSMLPFALSIAIYLVLRTIALSSVIGVNQNTQGLWERVLQNIYIIPKYAMVVLLPVQLNAYYSLPQNYLAGAVWLFPVWLAIIAAFFFLSKKNIATKFGLLWLAINFIPISNIIPIPSAPMAERYLYLPAIGLWLVVADQAYGLYARSSFKKTLIAAGAAVAICLAVIAVNRNTDWRDDLSFYTSMAEANPDSALAHYSLGLAYQERNDIPTAQSEWKRTAQIDPGYFNVLGHLAESYVMIGSLEEAEYYYTQELAVHPNNATAVYDLAVLNEKLNRSREALMYYERFLTMQPYAYADLIPKVNAKIALLKKERHHNY